jgi:hypothetical protein
MLALVRTFAGETDEKLALHLQIEMGEAKLDVELTEVL